MISFEKYIYVEDVEGERKRGGGKKRNKEGRGSGRQKERRQVGGEKDIANDQ